MARSPALPHDARLDLSNTGDGGLCLRWDDAHSLAYYRLSADGSWVLTWAQFFSAPAFDFENGFCGIWRSCAWDDGSTAGLTVCTLAGANLLEDGVDLSLIHIYGRQAADSHRQPGRFLHGI